MCGEVIEPYNKEIKTIPTNFNEKNIICKTLNSYILLTFLLIIVTLLITVKIYCYLIKYQSKQKHFLPLYETKLKQFCVGSID